tara:strand:- start:1868 stop:4483 length:2616 start_codon:yes stop_codon:yes gene_type:complete
MATIRKNSKINFYKFVQVKEPSTNARGRAPSGQMEVVKTINNNTVAINNLGATVNSIGAIAQDFKKIQLRRLELAVKSQKTFDAEFTETKKKKKFAGFSPAALVKKPSWLEGLFNMLSGLIKAAIIIPALEWLSDPENREKVSRFIEVLSKLATFIFKVAQFGVVNTIEGLYTLLSDESSPWEKIGGLVRGLTGLGTLLLGLRWLSNPTRIITDFGNVLIFLHNNLIRGRRGLLGRAGALGLVAGAAYGGFKLYQFLNEDGSGGQPDPNDKGKSQGGKVLGSFAQGGWISGPMSGYPVSLDGGMSTSFIGHGTEYVARKADGGAFVVPYNTPATKTQPNLTNKRLGEAKSQGFLKGFSDGGTLPRGKRLSQKGAFDHVFELAKRAGGAKYPQIVAAQAMHETGYLNPHLNSVYNATARTNAFGQTGDRGFGTIPREGSVNGWAKYNNLFSAVKDNIKLWHDVANHPENYNAFGNPLDGIAAVAKAYSPNADPANIRLGYTTDGYSKGIVKALKVGGFDVKRMASSPLSSSQNSGGSRPQGGGNFFTNNFRRLKNFLGFGDDSQEKPTTSSSRNASGTIKPASHPETGSGFTIEGTRDQSNRPIVLSEPAAEQFAAAIKASGMDLASYVASSGRSRAKNSSIGGHPESHHLFGEALDINGEGYQWLKANGRRFGWEYVYNHNAGSAHFKYVGPKAGSTPILAAPGDNAAGGNSLHGHVGEGSREGSRDTGRSKVMSPEAKTLFDELFKTPSSAEGMRIGSGRGPAGTAPASQFQQARQQRQLQEQTKTRDNARKQLIERSQEMIREVMAAVAQQNGVNTQAIQSAQQALAVVAGQANSGGSQFLNTGSGGTSSTTIASSLQSVLNPLRGIIR